MSRFTVCRSWNGYCLLLDDDRIAGGKPDYHEGNVLYEWKTRDTYGSVDELEAENAKLRAQLGDACMQLGGAWVRCTELRELARFIMHQCNDGNPRCEECIGWNDGECVALQRMRELWVEVDG